MHSWSIFKRETLHGVVQLVQALEKPLVHLGPLSREVILDEDCNHEGELVVAVFGQYYLVGVLDKL